jgi:hypothetical protein
VGSVPSSGMSPLATMISFANGRSAAGVPHPVGNRIGEFVESPPQFAA